MPTLLPIKIRTELARSLYRDIANNNDFYYIAFGRTLPWGPGTSEIVPTPTDTRTVIADALVNTMAIKQINSSNIALMIPRVDWVSGTTYDRYDDDVDLSTKNFYVYVPENYCIYKCLNRPSPLVSSTSEPLQTIAEKFQTADGYWWKLMYEIPTYDRNNFITTNYLPVRYYSSGQMFDRDGIVGGFTITSQGSGYTSAPTVIITGDGSGAAGTAIINSLGDVTSIEIVSQGSGYSYALVELVGGGGVGAAATIQLEISDPADALNSLIASTAQAQNGQIDFIDIVSGGSGYNAGNILYAVVGDGINATPTLTYDANGAISSVTTGDSGEGTGYTFATVAIGSSVGVGAVLKPIIGPPGGHGSNVPSELLATTVGISVDVSDVLTDFFINNDFRQVSIIKNVHKYGIDAGVYTGSSGDASYVIGVSDPSNYHLDDMIYSDDGGVFTVININGGNIKILPSVDIMIATSPFSTLSNASTGAVLAPLLSVIPPEINNKSGDIIYLKNISPIVRAVGQTETLQLFLHF